MQTLGASRQVQCLFWGVIDLVQVAFFRFSALEIELIYPFDNLLLFSC